MPIFSRNLVAASLEPLLLSLLSEGEMYGYEILQRVESVSAGKLRWTASKLYPMLHDLEHRGLARARWIPSESGPDRKYYALTRKGAAALETARRDWLEINAILARLWGPGYTLTRPALG
jgi:PadR family transcriptional regulator, regulatory protein PadR